MKKKICGCLVMLLALTGFVKSVAAAEPTSIKGNTSSKIRFIDDETKIYIADAETALGKDEENYVLLRYRFRTSTLLEAVSEEPQTKAVEVTVKIAETKKILQSKIVHVDVNKQVSPYDTLAFTKDEFAGLVSTEEAPLNFEISFQPLIEKEWLYYPFKSKTGPDKSSIIIPFFLPDETGDWRVNQTAENLDAVGIPSTSTENDARAWAKKVLNNETTTDGTGQKRAIGARYSAELDVKKEYVESEDITLFYEYVNVKIALMNNKQISGYGFAPKIWLAYSVDQRDFNLSDEDDALFRELIKDYDEMVEKETQLSLEVTEAYGKDIDGEQMQYLTFLADANGGRKVKLSNTIKKLNEQEEESTGKSQRLLIGELALPEDQADIPVKRGDGTILDTPKAGEKVRYGGKKIYFDFWPKEINQKREVSYYIENFGMSKMSLNITTNYKIVGYMYNHYEQGKASKTANRDKIIFSSVDANSSATSEKLKKAGWKAEEIKWLSQD